MSVQQYLQRHAEEQSALTAGLSQQWQHVVCIPAMNEGDALPGLLERVADEKDVLLILVLNTPSNAGAELLEATRFQAQELKNQYRLLQSPAEHAALLELNQHGSHLLLIEAYGLPQKEGVGLARKIACDIACQLIQEKKVLSPWIHNTDADVSLPVDYFSVNPDKNLAAALYPFRHEPNPDPHMQLCLSLYEFSLHYYVAALDWAGSPYAYHSIGSTLLISHRHYALARGFPKRAGGEDFYLLNKLAKTGPVRNLQAPVLHLSGRNSDRVPFGTGPAITRISKLEDPLEDYQYYHPRCFLYLRLWLHAIPQIWEKQSLSSLASHQYLLDALRSIGMEDALQHARQQSRSRKTFERHIHNWFDAFRTLKLVHRLRDGGLASVNHPTLRAMGRKYAFIDRLFQSEAGSNT